MKKAFEDIEAERVRQDAKWGEQNHGPHRWLAILMEEVGEAAEAMLESSVGAGRLMGDEVEAVQLDGTEKAMREELVHSAAVLVAWIECIDRRAE